ncbi:MAG TPA: CSLREA domain-containing protein [Thermoanaerobaculia bacterium]|nr:CSLREA domain-containing protein [Thermoanaerobaculia bacterium]
MKWLRVGFSLAAAAALAAQGAFATLITVNSTADTEVDSGQCTLREAIKAANNNAQSGAMPGECAAGEASPTVDSIVFTIAGTGHTISPSSQLPSITQTVTIDGGNNGTATDRVQISGGGTVSSGLVAEFTSGVTIENFVINGFTSRQIGMFDATGFVVEGCYLGINPAGDAVVAGSGRGVDTSAFNSTSGRIGGPTAAQRNVIASPDGTPIFVGGSSVTIEGNYIGVNASGTTRLGAVATAVNVSNSGVTIGGALAGARNVIVADTGILFGGNPGGGKSGGTVRGNYIGTDLTGTVALNAGQGAGIDVLHAQNVLIIGNLISGNGEGILLRSSGQTGASSDSTIVTGNLIGTSVNGASALGNTRQGVRINSSDKNRIGGSGDSDSNVIAFNGQAGVQVDGGTMNLVLRNSIHSNGGRGIALTASAAALPNDADDPDGGPNNLQNYPVIDDADLSSGNVILSGALDSLASTTFRLEFFANPTCDASGNGEGRTYLGSTEVTTDGSGDASYSGLSFPFSGGPAITATATLKTMTPSFTDTSEFSACKLAATLDVDGNGAYAPLTDGLLVLRYLFGFSGPTLTSNAIGAGATRTTPEQIDEYLDSLFSALDIDLNGEKAPLTDGLLVLRYLFGFRGPSLILSAIGSNAERDTAMEVEDYIATLVPAI